MKGVGAILQNAVRMAVKPFSLAEDEFSAYLKSLNDLPAYDIVLHFHEVMLLFEQDKGKSGLSETQISCVKKFVGKVLALPPESDDLWSRPHVDLRWNEITHSASELLAILSGQALNLFTGSTLSLDDR